MTNSGRAARPLAARRGASAATLALSYAAFVSLGLPDTVLGIAWPTLRDGFGRSQAGLGVVLAAGVAGYFVSAGAAGELARRLGLGRLLVASSAAVAVGLAGYALAPAWWLVLVAAVVVGLGSGAVDAGINAFAAHHFPARHVNWLHGCWSIGATAGPAAMTAAVAGASYRAGYAVLAASIAAMGLAFARTRRAWDGRESTAGGFDGEGAPAPTARAVLRRGRTWLQLAIFFLYTGVESAAGMWSFTVLREGRGLGVEAAGSWTAAYWASHTAGRFILGAVVDRLGPDRLLRAASLGAAAGAIAFAASGGLAGRLGLLALGACFGPFFPTLMARTPARLGPGAVHAVGFQVSAATVGVAVLPSGAGVLGDVAGVGAIPSAIAGGALALLALHELLVARTRAASSIG